MATANFPRFLGETVVYVSCFSKGCIGRKIRRWETTRFYEGRLKKRKTKIKQATNTRFISLFLFFFFFFLLEATRFLTAIVAWSGRELIVGNAGWKMCRKVGEVVEQKRV